MVKNGCWICRSGKCVFSELVFKGLVSTARLLELLVPELGPNLSESVPNSLFLAIVKGHIRHLHPVRHYRRDAPTPSTGTRNQIGL